MEGKSDSDSSSIHTEGSPQPGQNEEKTSSDKLKKTLKPQGEKYLRRLLRGFE